MFSDSDKKHLSSAQGWLELGNHLEANEELDQITASMRTHPDVLELRWVVFYRAGRFEVCLDIGNALVMAVPNRAESWLNRATALFYLKRSAEAFSALVLVAETFPKDWRIAYDLACYACATDQIKEAEAWFKRAVNLGENKKLSCVEYGKLQNPQTVQELALDDPHLEKLWRLDP